jgi:hypothetical protein
MKRDYTILVLIVVSLLFITLIARAASVSFGTFSPTGTEVLSIGQLSDDVVKGDAVIVTEDSGTYYIAKFTNPLGDAADFDLGVLAFGYMNASGLKGEVKPMTALWYRPAIEADFD